MKYPSPMALAAGAGGLALLLCGMLPISALSQGDMGAKAAVFLLLAALAALAVWLLHRSGIRSDRLCLALLPIAALAVTENVPYIYYT